MDSEELKSALNELKFLAYFDGNFQVINREGKLTFEIRTKEQGHNEPHFHVKTSDYEASYSINSFERLAGVFPSKTEKQIIKWAEKNRDMLKDIWNTYHGDFIRVI